MSFICTMKSYKGGIGSTSLTIDIATELKLRGKKVLVIDLDENTTMTSNIAAKYDQRNIYNVIKGNIQIEESIQHLEIFDLIAGSPQMSLFGEEFKETDDIFVLKDLCDLLKDKYEYIFFDNCAGRNKLFTATILACNSSILPTLNDEGSLNQVKDTTAEIDIIKKSRAYGPYCDIEVIGYVLNRYRKNGVSDNTLELLDEMANEKAFIYTVADAVVISENKTFKKSTMQYPSNTKTRKIQEDIRAIADAIEKNKKDRGL